MANLPSASVPKYSTSGLFLSETAHTLKSIVNYLAMRATTDERDLPQRDEDVGGEYEKHDNDKLNVGPNKVSGECGISDGKSSTRADAIRISYKVYGRCQYWWSASDSQADRGVVRICDVINLPKLVPHENYPVLSTARDPPE